MSKNRRAIIYGLSGTLAVGVVLLIVFRATSEPPPPDFRMTSLHQLTRFERPDILENEYRQLTEQGVGIDDLDEQGCTALFHAVYYDNLAAVEFMLNEGADPNLCGPGTDPPIVWASRGIKPVNCPIVEALIEAGAEVNVSEPNEGKTPLHFASAVGNFNVAQVLIHSGADVNVPDAHDRSTPLQFAAARGRARIVDLLLASGADPEVRNDRGYRPIDQINACLNPEEIQAVFRSHGADDQRRPELIEQFAAQGD